MTTQVAETLEKILLPEGVWRWSSRPSHLCMMMRGVERQNAFAITSSMHGVVPE